jgi:tRNA A-37 threonylcarbamoyl transferase component Bud32
MIKPFGKTKCKIIKEGHNPVCIITVKDKRNILGIDLYSGKYILKNITKEEISKKDIELLKSLSNLKLIPRIYLIDGKYIIMDYFEGVTLNVYLRTKVLSDRLITKIENLIKKWHDLGFAHGDMALLLKENKIIGGGNLLIDKNNKIILIDPTIGKIYDKSKRTSQLNLKKKYDFLFLKELKDFKVKQNEYYNK